MPIVPRWFAPGHGQGSNTQQRLVGCGFIPNPGVAGDGIGFTLPLAIGVGASSDTPDILAAGFNSGMLQAACTGANVSVSLVHVDPFTGGVLTPLRALGTLVAAGAIVILAFGVGTAGLTAGAGDTFAVVRFRFTNVGAAPATLDTFPGIWWQAR